MKYPIAIEPGDKRHAFGVDVPDLPGCFSAGDTLDEAIENAMEAIELWLETVIDDGGPVPEPGHITKHQANAEYAGWVWKDFLRTHLARVTLDPDNLTVRFNYEIPLFRGDNLASPGGFEPPYSP